MIDKKGMEKIFTLSRLLLLWCVVKVRALLSPWCVLAELTTLMAIYTSLCRHMIVGCSSCGPGWCDCCL